MKTLMMLAPIVALAACAANTAAGPAAERRQSADQFALAEARPAGEAVDCVRTRDINETHVRSNEVIDFVMSNGRVYRNTLPNGCPDLRVEERFGYQTVSGQLCAIDMITVLRAGVGPGQNCGLGKFQPVEIPKRP